MDTCLHQKPLSVGKEWTIMNLFEGFHEGSQQFTQPATSLRCHGCRISALCGAPPGSLCGWPQWWTTTNGATSGRSFCWNSNLGAMRLGRCGCGVFGKKRPKVMNNYKIIWRSVYCIYLLYVHVLLCTCKRGKYQTVQHEMWNRIKHRNLFPLYFMIQSLRMWCRKVLAHWSVDTFVGVACDFLHQRVWHCLLSMILPMIRGSFLKRLAGLCFSTFFALVECGLLYHVCMGCSFEKGSEDA